MQTVNFQCGHCGNLMAVSTEYLGQQVRCPHCQQVVVAPSPSPPPPFSPLETPELPNLDPSPATAEGLADLLRIPPPAAPEDDIFSPPANEDIFGQGSGPRLEIPREPAPAPAPTLPPSLPANGEVPGGLGDPTLAYPGGGASGGAGELPLERTGEGPFPSDGLTSSLPAEAPSALAEATSARPAGRKARSSGLGMMALVLLVIVPLIVYSVMATVAIALLYMRQQTAPPNPFEAYPDITGDNPGVRPPKNKVDLKISVQDATAPLPANLLVPLGKTLTLGDLEVTPKHVERRIVRTFMEDYEEKPEPCPHESLVLVLHLRNLSRKWAFTPLDNYFDRKWKPGKGGSPPLTILEAGSQRFFGGPAEWYSQSNRKKAQRREWLEGRKDTDPDGLQPGSEMDGIVATDGRDAATASYLFGDEDRAPYRGKLLWRVQLRRGVINYRGREVPVTSVIGVQFSDKDYRRQG